MNEILYTWQDIDRAAEHICLEMYNQLWKPDYIIGIVEGGLPVATIISNKINVPLITLQVDFVNVEVGTETNCWLSEWAFGYNNPDETNIAGCRWDPALRKNLLIVDDINNTGKTIDWIKKDWCATCYPNELDAWKSVWNKNVRFAVIINNLASKSIADYNHKEINTAESSVDVFFPWDKKPKKCLQIT